MPGDRIPNQEELPLMNTEEQTSQGSSEQEQPQEKITTTANKAYQIMLDSGVHHYDDKKLWSALFKIWNEDKQKGGNPPLAEWEKESRFSIFSDTKKKIWSKFPKEVPEYVRNTPSVNDSVHVELTDEEKQKRAVYGEKSLRKIEAMFKMNPVVTENPQEHPVPEPSESRAIHSKYTIPVEPLDAKYRDQKSEAYVEPEEERRYP